MCASGYAVKWLTHVVQALADLVPMFILYLVFFIIFGVLGLHLFLGSGNNQCFRKFCGNTLFGLNLLPSAC